eukprot:4112724-Pleurochrysis_carterae.AAC.1
MYALPNFACSLRRWISLAAHVRTRRMRSLCARNSNSTSVAGVTRDHRCHATIRAPRVACHARRRIASAGAGGGSARPSAASFVTSWRACSRCWAARFRISSSASSRRAASARATSTAGTCSSSCSVAA